VEPAHFDWRWRERPALALLAWEALLAIRWRGYAASKWSQLERQLILGQRLSSIATSQYRQRTGAATGRRRGPMLRPHRPERPLRDFPTVDSSSDHGNALSRLKLPTEGDQAAEQRRDADCSERDRPWKIAQRSF